MVQRSFINFSNLSLSFRREVGGTTTKHACCQNVKHFGLQYHSKMKNRILHKDLTVDNLFVIHFSMHGCVGLKWCCNYLKFSTAVLINFRVHLELSSNTKNANDVVHSLCNHTKKVCRGTEI